MAGIYEPKGAAREYSPLALNYIKGCDHGCVYCYVPKILKVFDPNYIHSNIHVSDEQKVLQDVLRSAKKFSNSDRQVFLSFTTDPYSHFNNKTNLTRKVLKILLQHRIPVSILTKGGFNVLGDMDIFKAFGPNIQVGASLTFTNADDSKKWEKSAAVPEERFETLKNLHENGIKTWASMEPVIYPDQSLEIMELTKNYVNSYKIGKLNHFPNHEKNFNWTKFLDSAVQIMRKNDSTFYIKKDLLKWRSGNLILSGNEADMDYLALKNNFAQELSLFQ